MRVAAALLVVVLAATAHAESRVEKPWLGVSISEHTAYGGVGVLDVYDDTAATRCGLRAGDEIIGIGKTAVRSFDELRLTIGARSVGDRVQIAFVRDGHVRRCKTRLAAEINDPSERLQRRLVDKPVPPLELVRRSDSATIDDVALRGRITVLALFSLACDGCAATITELAKTAAGELASVDVYAVTAGDAGAIDAYVQRLGLTVEIARDEGRLARRFLQVPDEPTILVVDHEGVVRFAASGAGPDGAHLDAAAFCVRRAARALRDER